MEQHWTQERYIKAYRFAAEAHNGAKFKGTDLPYIVHPSLVGMEIIAALEAEPDGLDGELAVTCALLHDVLEDTERTFEEIRQQFGEQVAQGVLSLSKNKYPERKQSVEEYLGDLQRQPREVRMVKLADRITNLAPPPRQWSQDKIQEYRLEAIAIYQCLRSASEFLSKRLWDKIQNYPGTNVL